MKLTDGTGPFLSGSRLVLTFCVFVREVKKNPSSSMDLPSDIIWTGREASPRFLYDHTSDVTLQDPFLLVSDLDSSVQTRGKSKQAAERRSRLSSPTSSSLGRGEVLKNAAEVNK